MMFWMFGGRAKLQNLGRVLSVSDASDASDATEAGLMWPADC